MSDQPETDPCAKCIHKTAEYYETFCIECSRFYADRYDTGLETAEEV